jgi:glycosyltransferase involved in cell wall biosynthesis
MHLAEQEVSEAKSMKPSMSVGILTNNSGRTLRLCLKALFSQGFDRKELDVFLVDAGSSDGTLETAREFELQVYSEPGCTRGRGRNICIEKAKADILVMLDSDIIIPRGWLQKVWQHFVDPEVSEVASPYYTPVPKAGIVQKVIYYLSSGWAARHLGALERENWVSE